MSTNPNLPPDPGAPASGYQNVYQPPQSGFQTGYPPHYQQTYPQGYQQPPYGYTPPAAGGLSERSAGALAYITIVPAILFLVMEPYNRSAFVRFNALQCLFMTGICFAASLLNVIPILGTLAFAAVWLTMLAMWIFCLINAAQGKVFRVPLLGDLAAQQAGLR